MGSAPFIAVLVAVGSPSPFRPDAQQLFAGCRADRNGPNGRFYGCTDWNASLTGLPGFKPTSDQAVELMRSSVRGTLKGELREEKIELKLGGRNVLVLRLSPVDAAGQAEFGFAEVTIVPSGNGSRIATCVTRTDTVAQRERCARALDYMVSTGTPDGAEIDTPAAVGEAAILSHKLQVPRGCHVANANDVTGRIQCESSMLSWTTIPSKQVPSVDRWLEEIVPPVAASLGSGFTDERLPCHVEGTPTRCARLTKAVPSRGTMRLYIGTTVLDGQAVMVTCGFMEAGTGFAPVCNDTLALP